MVTSHNRLRRTLGVAPIVFLGLAYMSPFAVFDTFGVVSQETNGHVPASYILITIAILFTALSYGKMVKLFPDAGSAYTYTKKTMSAQLGFLVGWSALLDYLFLPMINAVLAGIYLSASFPEIPTWVWVVGLIIVMTLMNLTGIKIAVSVNALFVLFQLLVAIIFVSLTVHSILSGNDSSGFTTFPFFSKDMSTSLLFSGASILALSFLGFDAVTTLAEETITPEKTIPKGIFLIALIGGLFFILVTYFMQTLYPDVSVLKNIDGASPEIARHIGGILFQSLFTSGALISVLASGLAAQTSASRLLFSMGRDGVIPKRWFGSLHPKLLQPVFNIVFIGILSLSALFLDLVTATSMINFGAFTTFSFVNLSVIAYYLKNRRTIKLNVFGYLISPLIGLSFIIYLWMSLDLLALIFGLSWLFIGFVYLLLLTKGFRIKPPEYDFAETT
ncbi:APC family permease [Pullulanibacillus sp. KACC 23026]|uniref:APC family permease n=1 Tax=Pullulanibacillus sp. KACC 23026 TaxID=3028315 RepID=UPI0023B1D014|nr:APC family permease [Pullulanibacillus sp. KACC 23026]WEG11276.1 APC family permease [Pullulanibacillus sp. KACC 23026]